MLPTLTIDNAFDTGIFNPSLSCLVANNFGNPRKHTASDGIDIRDGESLGRLIATGFSGVGGIGTGWSLCRLAFWRELSLDPCTVWC
jgi:hypothetical protein